MNRKIIPQTSILHALLEALAITELPRSYQVLCGLSAIGACLKRNVFIDQIEFKVFPNMSVLLVGPSGIGKDLMIDQATEVIEEVGAIAVIGGRTIEYVKANLAKLGDPAACFIPLGELTAFLGGKDYQKSIVQELTDLLSTKRMCDISTKGDPGRIIPHPTLTIQAGSTEDWLIRAMPEGSLEGGFLPRFVIVCESYPSKHVPWIGEDMTAQDWARVRKAKKAFVDGVKSIEKEFRGQKHRMIPMPEAKDYYRSWYENRFKAFGPIALPYANRSRDQVHRLAMLMALSCGRNYLDLEDYVFAVGVMKYVASGIENVIAPAIQEQKRKRQR